VITSVQRRRRWSVAEKIRLVEETLQPGMSVSLVARELDRIAELRGPPLQIVSDNVLYREAGGWRGQQVSDRQFGLAA
jgi:hypothetical protein